MATTLTADTRRRSIGGRFRLRSYLAAAACTASLSTIAPLAPAVAQEKSLTIEDLTAAFKGGKGSVADLAGAIAGVQGEIARLEAEIGQRREAVNRALVDLQDARTELAQAKRGASTARTQLDDAQSAVEKAQERLNELSRTAYRRSTASESVATAAGGDAREKMLQRQSYLRSQADSQKEVVDQLEQERTEKANKESQLRKAEELAAAREQRAADAEAQARAILGSSQSAVEEAMSERSTLVAQQEEAQAALDAARGSRARTNAGASGPSATNGTQATQAARATQGNQGAKETVGNSNDSTSQPSTGASTTASDTASGSDTNTVTTSAAGEGTQTTVTAPTQDSSLAATEPTTTGTIDQQSGTTDASDTTTQTVEALTEMSSQNAAQGGATEQGSSVDGQTLAVAGGVFGAAAAMVAASQPDHTAFAQGSSFDEGQLSAIQNTLTAVSDAFNEQNKAGETGAVTNAASGADSDLVGDLDGVLESLDTTQSITEKASAAVASQGTDARIEAVIARAMSQVGTPYAWGGGDANGPTKGIRDGGVADSFGDYNKVGFDCSGLTLYAFSAAGISLPHYTGYQYNQGTKVDPSEMKRGDLIFYGPGGGQHVAIYLGDGTMIEAPESGSTVRVSPVRYGGMAPYAVRLIG